MVYCIQWSEYVNMTDVRILASSIFFNRFRLSFVISRPDERHVEASRDDNAREIEHDYKENNACY